MSPTTTITNDNVTLPKTEYLRLKKLAQAYKNIAARMFEMPLRDPIDEVLADFKATKLYTKEFLSDLETGLRNSSYMQKYANQSSK